MTTIRSRRRVSIAAFGAIALVALLWFAPLGARHLLRSDEGRYAEIAREMVATGDWVTVRYQGLKYFEKPPLQLWATAAAYELFGVGDWQARAWVALNGFFAACAVALAARRWWGPGVGWRSALVLIAAPLWTVGGHFNSLDMGLSGALAWVLAAVLWAQAPRSTPSERRRGMAVAWLAIGAAVMTKGPVGLVLPGLALIGYSLAARDAVVWRRLWLLPGAALALAVAVPWFWLVDRRNPEFARFFFIHEHWERYTSTVHHRDGPVWYFVPLVVLGFLPWIGLVPGMVRAAAGRLDTAAGTFRPGAWLAAWAIAIFCFFSASGSKLPGYILPIFPALAVLAGVALERVRPASWRRQLRVAAVVGGVAAVVCAGAGSVWSTAMAADMRGFVHGLVPAAALMAVGALVALGLSRRARPAASQLVYGLAVLAATSAGLLAHEALGGPASGAALVPAIQRVLTPEMPIYAVRLLDHTLPWYLRRTTIMVEAPDELEFGTVQEPQKWLPTLAAFEAVWRGGPPAIAVMSPQTHAQLRTDGLPMWAVAADARRVVVSNRPLVAMR